MPSAKAILYKNYQSKDKSYPVVISITYGAKNPKIHPTGYKITEKHWNGFEVKSSHPDAAVINSVILKLLTTAKNYIADCQVNNIPFNPEAVFTSGKTDTLNEYMRKRAQQYYDAGQVTMRDKIRRYLNDLQNCFGRDMHFSEFTADNVQKLNAYLMKGGTKSDHKKKPNGANTRIKKFSYLAQYYREATKSQETPFDIHIQPDPTNKTKLTEAELTKLESLDLEGSLALTRDLFLFSYYCRGARFANCVTMQKKFIHNGRITFRTNKGKKVISALIHSKLQAIIDRYKGSDSPFIIPYIKSDKDLDIIKRYWKNPTTDNKAAYLKVLDKANANATRWLAKICKIAGMKRVTFHEARHSVAYNLKKKGVHTSAIQDTLGQSSVRITEIYLKALDDEYIDTETSKLYGK